MAENTRYIEWHSKSNSPTETQISEIMKHWQQRYELGTAVLVTESPASVYKLAEKQWRKLTRQVQKERQAKAAAEDILEVTRTISRMQRVTFSNSAPDKNPGAKFYVLSPDELETLPAHCFTLYTTVDLPALPFLKLLPPDALIFAYSKPKQLPGIHKKSVLEERIISEETGLTQWLHSHGIEIDEVKTNIEKANEALDTLLGSSSLQTEFIAKAKNFLHLLQLAQPLALSPLQQTRLAAIKQLEHHVRVLSPAFLSDHVVDSQNEDSFLLRDPETGKVFTLDSIRAFIDAQQQAGRANLASALARQAGFVVA